MFNQRLFMQAQRQGGQMLRDLNPMGFMKDLPSPFGFNQATAKGLGSMAAGYFGARDLSGTGVRRGLAMAGRVGAGYVGANLAIGGIGLGMSAVSYLNPF